MNTRESLSKYILVVLFGLLSLNLQAQTTEHSDPTVSLAQQSLNAIQQKLDQMQPGDAATAQALMKQMAPIGQILGKVTDKTHPAWTAAATLYNQLNTGIPAKYNNAGATADPAIAQIAATLNQYEEKLNQMSAGDTATGIRLLEELKGVMVQINAVTTKGDPGYAAIANQYNALNQATANKANEVVASPSQGSPAPTQSYGNPNAEPLLSYQVATYKRLARQVDGSIETLNAANEAEVLSPDFKSRFMSGFQNYQTQLNKINRPDHPDVARLIAQVESIPTLINQRIQGASQSKQSLGNYEEKLAEIEARSREEIVPDPVYSPYFPEEVKTYIERTVKVKRDSQLNLEYLQSLVGSPFAPKNLNSRIYWQQDRIRDADASLKQTILSLRGSLEQTRHQLDIFKDATKDHLLLQEGEFAKRNKSIGELDIDYQGAEILFKFVNDTDWLANVAAYKAELAKVKTEMNNRFSDALESVRMPKSASDDEGLIQIAMDTLTSGRYEDVNPIKAIVVNFDKVHREKTEGDVTGNVSGLTITSYHYSWDEYQVTTAEKVGDVYYLYYSTLKNYSSGGSRTPLNRWIVANRIQGGQILEKNID